MQTSVDEDFPLFDGALFSLLVKGGCASGMTSPVSTLIAGPAGPSLQGPRGALRRLWP